MKDTTDYRGLYLWSGAVEGRNDSDFLVVTKQNDVRAAITKVKRAARRDGFTKARVTKVEAEGVIDA